MNAPERSSEEIRTACTRFLSHEAPRTQAAWLAELASSQPPAYPDRRSPAYPDRRSPAYPDRYGAGEPIATLERRVAALLGKPAAVFMTKGVSAQIIALRIHTSRRGVPVVALHPKCHLEIDEADAYRRVFGLAGVRLGRDHEPFTAADLEAVAEPLGCVTVELPLRRAGFKATPWPELARIAAFCRERNVPLHLDGARLWEVAPFYGRSHAEIAALGTSVYVSLYKGLGGLAGCVLAGEAEFVAEARLWQIRVGAVLPAAFPLALAALAGLDERLPEMADHHARATALARRLAAEPGFLVETTPPHGNAFRVNVRADAETFERAQLALAADTGFWLGGGPVATALPGWTSFEIAIGRGAHDWTDDEAVAALALARRRAGEGVTPVA